MGNDQPAQPTIDGDAVINSLGLQIGQLHVNLAIAQSELGRLRQENQGLREELLARQDSDPKEKPQ